MASKNGPRLLLGLVVLTVIGGFVWRSYSSRVSGPESHPVKALSAEKVAESSIASPALADENVGAAQKTESSTKSDAAREVTSSAANPVSNAAEIRATRSMYIAHAPLRAVEVADADSQANREILQSMVEKALKRKNLSK